MIGIGDERSRVLFQATQFYIKECLRIRSFSAPVDEVPPHLSPPIRIIEDTSVTDGYSTPTAKSPQNASTLDAWIADNPQALSAVQECDQAATVAIYGTSDGYVEAMSPLAQASSLIEIAVDSSQEFAELQQAWSVCMDHAGFVYKGPLEPWNQSWPNPRPSVRESETRRADLACRDEVQFGARIVDIRARSIEQWVRGGGLDMLSQVGEAYQGFVDRALKVLSGEISPSPT